MKRWLRSITLLTIVLAGCEAKEQTQIEENINNEPSEYIQDPSDIVDMHGDISNLDKFYEFVDHFEKGQKDKIRVVKYTTEGAPMLHDLEFDGAVIHSTRDGFGPGSIEEANCKGIAVLKTGTRTDYLLEACSNQEESELTILVIDET